MSIFTELRDAVVKQYAPESFEAYQAAKLETGDRDIALCRALLQLEFPSGEPSDCRFCSAWKIAYKAWQCIATPEVKFWIGWSIVSAVILITLFVMRR